jgi:hypothetical protein
MILFLRSALVSVFSLSGLVALAENPLSSTVTQVVVAALDVSETQALTFPVASVNSAQVVIAPANSAAGRFLVAGTTGTQYQLNLAPASLTLNRQGGGTDTLTVNAFNSDLVLGVQRTLAAGGDTHRIGATRLAIGPVQAGTYEGDITLTAVGP